MSQETPRYQRLRCIGTGGMGVVYEVLDGARGERIALKTLHPHKTSRQVLDLKHEFRFLANISHPHLINMRDLHVEGEDVFFTMDLIEGVDFVSYVWGAPRRDEDGEDVLGPPSQIPVWDQAMEGRLRHALNQLVEGVIAIHSYGLLHRDLKPSNILVTHDEKVIILDFGIAHDDLADHGVQSWNLGTPLYSSPEQAAGAGSTRASDWYAVGAILFQALFGFGPFCEDESPSSSLLVRKQREEVTLPALAGSRPADLCALAMGLLARRQSLRPDPHEILARLGARITPVPSTPPPVGLYFFVNRSREQALLRSSLEKSRRSPVVIEMTGKAGIGKSALCDLFAEQAIKEASAIVLRARCHEREAVAYNAFDGIMDDLRAYLETQRMNSLGALLPLDWDMLVGIFPGLGFGEYQAPSVDLETDAPAYRLLAFRAFRDVLHNISQKRPVVLIIDDAQWMDHDSLAIFNELLSKPLGVMLVVIHRPVTDPSPTLAQFSLIARTRSFVEYHHLDIGLLSEEDCFHLAASLLPEGYPDDLARRIAVEAGGNPFLVCQMAQYLADLAISGKPVTAALSVQVVVRERVRFLPRNLRRVLEILSIAGRPLAPDVLQILYPENQVEAALHRLRRLHLVQLTPSSRVDAPRQWEIYHDSIRRAVLASLDEGRTTHLHLTLARALQEAGDDDFEATALHFQEGGVHESVQSLLVAAARKAARGLAFERANDLYGRAVELDADPSDQLLLAWADALVCASQGERAARVLLKVAQRVPHAPGLEIKRQAVEQLLITGHFDEAAQLLGEVLAAAGGPRPSSSWKAWLGAVQLRMKLQSKPLRLVPKRAVSPSELMRIDTFRAMSWSFSLIDAGRSVYFDTLCLLEALDTGDTDRLIRALWSHSMYVAVAGVAARPRVDALLNFARSIAQDHGGALEQVGNEIAVRIHHMLYGEFPHCASNYKQLIAEFSSLAPRETWIRHLSQSIHARALAELGEWKEHAQILDVLIPAAEQRGDRYQANVLRGFYGYFRWLRLDQTDEAKKELALATELWPHKTFNAQTLAAEQGLAQIYAYEEDFERALDLALRLRKQVGRSSLRFQEITTVSLDYIIGCCAIALARASEARRGDGLLIARQVLKRMKKVPTDYARCGHSIVEAGMLHLKGQSKEAEQALSSAVQMGERSGRAFQASSARYARALLQGQSPSQAEETELGALRAQGVVAPARVAALFCPGFA